MSIKTLIRIDFGLIIYNEETVYALLAGSSDLMPKLFRNNFLEKVELKSYFC